MGATWFEGICYGWRVGAEDVPGGDGYPPDLRIDCEPKLYVRNLETGGPPLTDLDIDLADIPSGATVEHLGEWACGRVGLSDHVLLLMDAQDEVTVDISRALQSTPWLPVWASPGAVSACDVLGRPAVCVANRADRLDDFAYVFVIEDGTFDPHAVVLRLYSEEVPLAELLLIAESVVGA